MKYTLRFLITTLFIPFLSFAALAQNTSPINVIEFNKIQNGIMDEGKLQKNQLEDYDNNPVCLVKVKSQGFDEATLQKLIFVPKNIMIMHKAYENGEYRLYVSSKKPGSIVIKYQGDCEFKLPYNLEPKKIYELVLGMETATLNIISTPDNATIYIDNEKVGVGYASKSVSIGAEHKYKVECEDYITEENTITFTRSEKKELNVELRPDFGYITVKSTPTGAEVYVDKKKVGVTPYQVEKIKRGQHVLEVRNDGYESFADMITIKAGEVNKQFENVTLVAVKVVTGTLVLESNPAGASVTINGHQYGQTPKTLTEFPVGTYTIYFTKDGYQNLSQNIELKDGMSETVSVSMIKMSVDPQHVQTGTTSVVNSSENVPATGKINGHDYVDLGLPSGTLWATCNVGANSPEDYGNYYAWGETTTKKTYNMSTYKYCSGIYENLPKYNTQYYYGKVDNKKVLEMTDDVARTNWGGSWRMPTNEELKELYLKCKWTWTTLRDMNGYRVTGTNGNSIFIPAAGYCGYSFGESGYGSESGSYGAYWSASLSVGYPIYAEYLFFSSASSIYTNSTFRHYGMSVRPVSTPQK